VSETPIYNLDFIPGSELLLPITDLMPYLDVVAEMISHDVTNMGDAELAGGYAFLEKDYYLFGVEDDSTLYDTAKWDEAPNLLRRDRVATIYHACDHFIHLRLINELVELRHERSGSEYAMRFTLFCDLIQKASNQLRDFAVNFTSIYAKYLSINNPSLKDAYSAAFENFSNRPQWFSQSGW
jgi:hypothetical protein